MNPSKWLHSQHHREQLFHLVGYYLVGEHSAGVFHNKGSVLLWKTPAEIIRVGSLFCVEYEVEHLEKTVFLTKQKKHAC